MKYYIDEAYLIKRMLYIRGWCFSDQNIAIKIDIITRNKIYSNIDYDLQYRL